MKQTGFMYDRRGKITQVGKGRTGKVSRKQAIGFEGQFTCWLVGSSWRAFPFRQLDHLLPFHPLERRQIHLRKNLLESKTLGQRWSCCLRTLPSIEELPIDGFAWLLEKLECLRPVKLKEQIELIGEIEKRERSAWSGKKEDLTQEPRSNRMETQALTCLINLAASTSALAAITLLSPILRWVAAEERDS